MSINSQPYPFTDEFCPKVYDYMDANLAGATTDVYTYKTGGASGTTVATVPLFRMDT